MAQPSVPPFSIDINDPAFVADPYPIYARLRSTAPVAYIPTLRSWWITSYPLITQAVADPRFGKEMPPDLPKPQLPPHLAAYVGLPKHMLASDPPDHTRLRGLMSRAFTPRTVEQLRPRIRQIADDLLDQVQDRGDMNLVDDYAFQLPAIVIAELLGVPLADRDQFREWTIRIVAGLDIHVPLDVQLKWSQAQLDLQQYFADLIAERRRHPQDDLISEMIRAEEQGDRLNAGEMASMCRLLLVAGHETTATLLGSGTLTLLRQRTAWETLLATPALIPAAVEELLRYESPVQRFERIMQEDAELGGQTLRKGDRVWMVYAAANRDPAVFPDPDRLDFARNPNPHMAFGRGLHFCLGAPLARVEASIGLERLLARMPDLALAEPGPVWTGATVIRGLKSLPVRF